MFPVVAQFERCSVVGELPMGPWSVVAVDRWHGLGVLGLEVGKVGWRLQHAKGQPASEGPTKTIQATDLSHFATCAQLR